MRKLLVVSVFFDGDEMVTKTLKMHKMVPKSPELAPFSSLEAKIARNGAKIARIDTIFGTNLLFETGKVKNCLKLVTSLLFETGKVKNLRKIKSSRRPTQKRN